MGRPDRSPHPVHLGVVELGEVQQRLIRARVAAARRLAVNELVTYVMIYNVASINSLVNCGFRFYVPATKWGGTTAVYLCKAL